MGTSAAASGGGAGTPESLERVPRHVAIIMDGNGRWAQARGLPRAAGHKAGTENLRCVLRAAVDFGVRVLTVYAFSTENWSRPEWEVNALMLLLENGLDNEVSDLHANGVKIHHIGRTAGLAPRLLEKIRRAQELTQNNDRLQLNVALNYGGRAEIVDAVRQIVAEGIPPNKIDEETISRHLYTQGIIDPDLVIRTAGEMRLSNLLTWQATYAEFYATPVYWPDFGRDEFYRALLAYQQRERRFGRLTGDSS
jgi:undecaprenyl diphosphate synthase